MVLRWFRRDSDENDEPEYGLIAPWLLVGPALDARGYAHLAEKGVTHVLDLRSEASDDPAVMEELGLQWKRVPVDDQEAPTRAQLDEINDWLDAVPEERPPVVYVHCEGGLGRSPTVAMALLMRRGFSHAEAHRLVLGARSVAAPTPPQVSWLAEIEREVRTHAQGDDSDESVRQAT